MSPSFWTLILLISFPAVNAVLYSPALPAITDYFAITSDAAQQTITIYLLGYTLGQLLYGPIANRYGRKPAIYAGLSIQILSSLLCVLAAHLHQFTWFTGARFLMAIGAGVGLKIVFTLVNEYYPPKIASQKISYLILAFAVAPGVAISIGGLLTQYFHWISCFYFLAAYGLLMMALSSRLPETKTVLDLNAFEIHHLIEGYTSQFKNKQLVAAGLLMGCGCSLIYLFATLAPFIAIGHYGLSSAEYGFANFIPSAGMFIGGLLSAQLLKKYSIVKVISIGIPLNCLGVGLMALGIYLDWPVFAALFFPAMIMLLGNALVYGNASTLGLQSTEDKAHGSAVMNFLNMGLGTFSVFSLSLHSLDLRFILPAMCIAFCFFALLDFKWLRGNV
jgi:MFS family permease